MRVKVHPHKPMVDNGSEACVSVTPMKKRGRAYYMGTVLLSNIEFVVHPSGHKRFKDEDVRNVHAWVTGEILSESIEQNPMPVLDSMLKVRYDLEQGKFLVGKQDVTDTKRRAAVVLGKNLYISKE